jgi:hypothetical protein
MLYSFDRNYGFIPAQKLYCMATGSIKISRTTNKHADAKAIPRLLFILFSIL